MFRTDLSFDPFTQEFWTVAKQQNWPYFMLATKPLNTILIKTCMRGILKVMLNLSSLISRSNLFYNRHWIGEDYLTQFTNSTRRLTCSFILNSISLYRIDPRPVNRDEIQASCNWSRVCDLSIRVKVLWLAHLLLEKDIIPTFKWSIDNIRADDLNVFLLQNLSCDSKSANTGAG